YPSSPPPQAATTIDSTPRNAISRTMERGRLSTISLPPFEAVPRDLARVGEMTRPTGQTVRNHDPGCIPVEYRRTCQPNSHPPGSLRLTGSATPKPSSEAIYAELRERICLLDLPPGTPLREQALAEEFGVSRAPIREALTMLRVDGLVTPRDGGG